MIKKVLPRSCRGVCVKRLTNLNGARRGNEDYNAFTLIELIVVVGIIIILTGLVLSTVGYARKKGARARAETEIAAMSAACESYKADNGVYPRDNPTPGYTDALDARQNGDPTQSVYQNASLYLFTKLSGLNQNQTPITGARSYFSFKPQMLSIDSNGLVTAIKDPFGNSYGYSTINQTDPTKGYNPTFDLWSTVGLTDPPLSPDPNDPGPTPQWIKNW